MSIVLTEYQSDSQTVKLADIVRLKIEQRIGWIRHIVRMDKERTAKE